MLPLQTGCYIGQETIAKLITYNGVKQELWGIELEAAVTPGTPIMVDGQKVEYAVSLLYRLTWTLIFIAEK